MHRPIQVALAGLFYLGAAGLSLAQDAALTVTDGTQTVAFTREELGEMQQEVIETSIPWLDDDPDTTWMGGVQKFSGPSFTTLLNEAGLSGGTVTATAVDGYEVEIPRERLTGDGAILATGLNDQPLPEDKAPFWVVFPYDKPGMSDADHEGWSAWAVEKLTIR